MTPARLEIGTWPTPVRRMDVVSEQTGADIWVKLEEECGVWGGNKVRKLEYILGAALEDGVTTLVSYGAGTSNWAAALALHAADAGLDVVLGLAGPIPAPYAGIYERPEVTLVQSRFLNALPVVVAAARVKAGRKARSVPMGGTGPGDAGSLHIGEEIAADIRHKLLPVPTAIYVAAGTTGTCAGTAAGLALHGYPVPVVAVRVAPLPYGTARRARRHALSLLRRADSKARLDIQGENRLVAPGYGRPNAASQEAIAVARADGVELDGTYAAKAFAALLDRARTRGGETLLFIHTSPGSVPR